MTPLPAPASPNSYLEAVQNFQRAALDGIQSGNYRPFIYPYCALGPNLLILYLLLPATQSKPVYYLRYPVFALIIYHSIDGILNCRSPMVTVGYGIGLLNSWSVLWAATLVIFNDARGSFKRIEPFTVKREAIDGEKDEINGHAGSSEAVMFQQTDLRKRFTNDGAQPTENPSSSRQTSDKVQTFYHWQTLPPSFPHRLDWVTDLCCSFRGPRWAHAISGMTPPPASIQATLHKDPSLPSPTPYSSITRLQLLQRNLPEFLFCLVALDAIKTITTLDPYFWSLGPDSPSPFPYPNYTRLLLSVAFTYVSLQTIFLLAPLVFACALGPERVGHHAWPWLYTPYFGSPRQIAKKGLAGVWGQWWQQLFRFGFEEAGEAAARVGGRGWEKKTTKGTFLRVAVAFAASGALHACASYTTLGPTRPITGSFAFFMVQPVGLLGQRAVASWMRKTGWRERVPGWTREVGNMVFVFVWFGMTGPLVADDFAATGIWLYEPIPVSLIRGVRGQGWWWWGGTWARWYRAERWWKSGLGF